MSFYLVHDPDGDRDVWLAWEDTAQVRIYVYSPNLGEFVRSDAVAHDFYWDMEMQYHPVDVEEAARIVGAGQVGKLDARVGWQKGILDRLSVGDDRKTPAELLGASRIRPARISPQRAAKARAEKLSSAPIGHWITWKRYAPDQRQRAYVAVNDLRAGKVKTVADIGVDVRLVQDGEAHLLVQVARLSTARTSNVTDIAVARRRVAAKPASRAVAAAAKQPVKRAAAAAAKPAKRTVAAAKPAKRVAAAKPAKRAAAAAVAEERPQSAAKPKSVQR